MARESVCSLEELMTRGAAGREVREASARCSNRRCHADQGGSAAPDRTELGQIEIWINNAMTSVFSPIKQMTAANFNA